MLQKLDSPANVCAVEVVGKLEKADYDTVLLPALRAQIDGPGEIRIVFVFGERYEGLTIGGNLADTKLYVGELFHHELSNGSVVPSSPKNPGCATPSACFAS